MRTLVFILFFSFANLANAQTLTGIGKIQLGKPLGIIDDLASELNTKIQSQSDILDDTDMNQRVGIWELLMNEKNPLMSPPFASACPETKVYKIKGYSVAGIKFADMHLKFLNGELISISTDYSTEITEALKTKYGSPTTDLKKENKQCGGSYIEETTITDRYPSPENVNATGVLRQYYDYKCKQSVMAYLTISTTDKSSEASTCHRYYYDKLKSSANDKKKDALKDF